MWQKHDYDTIPGTHVFNGERSNKGYRINKMAFSFNEAANRDEFAHDMGAYCDKFALNQDEKTAVLAGDFNRLLELGGNIYYLAKIAIFHGMSVQDACANMSKITTEEFIQRLQKNSTGFQQKLDKIGGYFGG
jgi:protocatechuate 4,5-dioxygenase, alpha chain